MKKIIFIASIISLTTISITADNTIGVSGTVLPSAVVGFSDVSGESLGGADKFIDASIDLGSTELNSRFSTITNNFYVKSNNPNGVNISITPHAGEDTDGAITGPNGEIIEITYYLDGFNIYDMTSSSTVSLTSVATAGDVAGKTFTAVAERPNINTAGFYDTVLDVTITTP